MTDEFQNLPDDADAYEVGLAFDRALDAAPDDHALLRRWTARFPQFADDLGAVGYARFALGLTLTDPVAEYTVAEYAAGDAAPARPPLASLVQDAEAWGLTGPALAERLRLNRLLLGRLEQRAVAAATLPRTLVSALAQTLDRSVDEVAAYLRGGPRLPAQAHYLARRAPSLIAESPAAKMSFADALAQARTLPDSDRAYWQSEIEAGVLGEAPEESSREESSSDE